MEDLRETFDTLRSYNMKLNLGKCVFGVTARKFLRKLKKKNSDIATDMTQ